MNRYSFLQIIDCTDKYSNKFIKGCFIVALITTITIFLLFKSFLNEKKESINFSIKMIEEIQIEHDNELEIDRKASIKATQNVMKKMLSNDRKAYCQYYIIFLIIICFFCIITFLIYINILIYIKNTAINGG